MKIRALRVRHSMSSYRRLRGWFIRLIAGMPGSRRLATAVLADQISEAVRADVTVPLDIRPGRYFLHGKGRRLPIVVVVSTGADQNHAERLCSAIEHAQFTTGSFRPLFIVDVNNFEPFRKRGYAVERLMSADEYRQVNPHDSYSEYLFSRVATIARRYGASAVVPLPAELPLPDPPLLRLIGALVPRSS